MIRDLGLSPPKSGARLVKQSMSANMVLELARAMPENTAAWRQAHRVSTRAA